MMTKTTTPEKRAWRPFASLGAKITLILLSMAGVSLLLGATAYMVFSRVNQSMEELTASKLVTLQHSSHLVQASDVARNAMLSVLTARDPAVLDAQLDGVDAATNALIEVVLDLPQEMQDRVLDDAQSAADTLSDLVRARTIQFKNEAAIAQQLASLQTHSASLQAIMIELADEANFDLAIGGEATIEAVEGTLADLVEHRFAALQGVMQARAEINLLSGVLYSIHLTADPATRAILDDLATASLERLGATHASLDGNTYAAEHLDLIATGIAAFAELGAGNTGAKPDIRQRILALRRDLDIGLSGALDDMSFMLILAAEEAVTGNRDAIKALLDSEVARIITLFQASTDRKSTRLNSSHWLQSRMPSSA